MIKHVVCFKLKDNCQAEKDKAKSVLLSMQGNVSLLKGIEVGTDFLGSARSYDVILITTFSTKADLDAYQCNEYHCQVVKTYMHAHVETSVAIDYEI